MTISAKRYVLFNRPGTEHLLRKASGHGLGHLVPPYDEPAEERRTRIARIGVPLWQEDLWKAIIRAAETDAPDDVDYETLKNFIEPAGSQYAATTPELLKWFKGYNERNWINRGDLIRDFERIPAALPDSELRGQVFNYFNKVLHKRRDREPNQKERAEAASKTLIQFPILLDHFIKMKEQNGERARDISAEKVSETEEMFDANVRALQSILHAHSDFYRLPGRTYEETHRRLAFFKDVIENKGGHRIFWHGNEAIQRESDLQILYRFVWFGSPSDVGTEANDGRGRLTSRSPSEEGTKPSCR